MNNKPNEDSGTLAVKSKNQFKLTPRKGAKSIGLNFKKKSKPAPVAKMPSNTLKGKKWMLSDSGAVKA